jgi:hypothetical protein
MPVWLIVCLTICAIGTVWALVNFARNSGTGTDSYKVYQQWLKREEARVRLKNEERLKQEG